MSSFSVKDYGAVGDGAHDDTVPIQNAINAAAPENGMVFFPAGTYKITATLTGDTSCNLSAIKGSAILTGSVDPLLVVSILYPGRTSSVTPQRSPFISGLVFAVGAANGALRIVHDQFADLGAPQPVITDCVFDMRQNAHGATSACVKLVYTYGAAISRCSWVGPRDGGDITALRFLYLSGCSATSVNQCNMECGGVGIYADAFAGNKNQGLNVANCCIDSCVIAAVYVDGSIGDSYIGNTLDNSQQAIHIKSGDEIQIIGNYCGSNALTPVDDTATITIDNASFISVIGNTIVAYVAGNYGIELGPTAAIGEVVIMGNTFQSNFTFASYLSIPVGANLLRVMFENNNANAVCTEAPIAITGTVPPSYLAIRRNMMNGVNPASGLTPPVVSTAPTSNPFPYDCTVYIQGGTAVTVAVGSIGFASTSLGAANPGIVRLQVGQTITLTYTAAPTWVWIGD